MKNILVLGGLGYLGGRITKYICDLGYSVRVTTRQNSKDFPKNIPVNCEVIQVDYTKNFQLDKIMSGIDCAIDLVGPDSQQNNNINHLITLLLHMIQFHY